MSANDPKRTWAGKFAVTHKTAVKFPLLKTGSPNVDPGQRVMLCRRNRRIHTGDISHLSKEKEFNDADHALSG
jgi:hypothetical protein